MDSTIMTCKCVADQLAAPSVYGITKFSDFWVQFFDDWSLTQIHIHEIIDRDVYQKPISDPTSEPYFYMTVTFQYGDTKQPVIMITNDGEDIRLHPGGVTLIHENLGYKMTSIQVSKKHKEAIKIAIDKLRRHCEN